MNDIQSIIIHFLDGSASEEEKEALTNWLTKTSDNRREFQEIRDLWLSTNLSSDNGEVERALAEFRKRRKSLFIVKKRTPAILISFMKIAALFILAFGSSYYLWKHTETSTSKLIVNKLITSDNGKGCFILPDSTVVWLNKNSILEYPEYFPSGKREVKLKGEAYFQVHKIADSKFHVHANDLSVEVTGTEFVVQNYDYRQTVETILLDGKVFINGNGRTELHPDQRFVLEKHSGSFAVDSVNSKNYIGWIQDKLEFDNAKLSDIFTQLEGWYGIEINCPRVYAEQTRMTFMIRDESKEEILRAVQMIIPVEYKWEDYILHIIPPQ